MAISFLKIGSHKELCQQIENNFSKNFDAQQCNIFFKDMET